MAYDPNKDQRQNKISTPESLGNRAEVLTPGSPDLAEYAKAVEVVAAGDLVYLPTQNLDADTITATNAPVGYTTKVRVSRVLAGTTATVIAIYD